MFSHLKTLIPGAENWPDFLRNRSEQFEARLSLVTVNSGPSIFLTGMDGCRLPIVTSHGEGRATFANNTRRSLAESLVTLRYVDNYGEVAEKYPANPNGSVDGVCGLTTANGRVTIMMPHPERVVTTTQHSWHPQEWGEEGPWMRMFRNARAAIA
jgi:phosphoribosylformylglycinamidine synthase